MMVLLAVQLRSGLTMNNFYNNLHEREKKLLIIATVSIILLTIFILVKALYSDYKISSKNLIKAKSDYEYVFNKVSALKLSLDKKILNEDNINLLIKESDLNNLITEPSIGKSNELFSVTFIAKDIRSAINFSEIIINKTSLKIKNLNYKNANEGIRVELIFNF